MLPRLGMTGRLRWRVLRAQAEALVEELGAEAGPARSTGWSATSASASGSSSKSSRRWRWTAASSFSTSRRRPLAARERTAVRHHPRARRTRARADLRLASAGGDFCPVRSHHGAARGPGRGRRRRHGALTQGELVRLMVGRELSRHLCPRRRTPAAASADPPVLSVRNLRCPPRVRDVSFDVHRGRDPRPRRAGRRGPIGNRGGDLRPAPAASGTVALAAGRSRPRPARGDPRRHRLDPGGPARPGDRPRLLRAGEPAARASRRARRRSALAMATRTDAVRRLLALLELPQRRLLDDNMLNFSGGMQQKVILARWLVLRRSCCCWTSRLAALISAPAAASTRCCAASPPRAWPAWWCPRISRSCSASPTASWC